YRGFDPQLRRNVALKLIRRNAASASEQDELLREAQGMAQLSHANVLNVFDAGTFENQVFVVMELVEGITLARWLKQERRPWRAGCRSSSSTRSSRARSRRRTSIACGAASSPAASAIRPRTTSPGSCAICWSGR